jgi:hypothetical protein
MFCGDCGAQNPDTNQFCKNCGKPLAKRQQVPQAVARPAPVSSPASQQPVVASAVSGQPPVAAAVPVLAPGNAPKRQWNWPGIASVPLGILSFGILPVLLGLGAILLGIISLAWFRKATGRISISAIIGIVLGIAAIAVTVLLA